MLVRREASLPDKYIPELREACQRAGLNWDKFELTDNTCPPHPPRKNPIQELGDDIVLVRPQLLQYASSVAVAVRVRL